MDFAENSLGQALRHEFVAEKVVKIPDANEFDPLLRPVPGIFLSLM